MMRNSLVLAGVPIVVSWRAAAQTSDMPQKLVGVSQVAFEEHLRWEHMETLLSMGGGVIAFVVSTAFIVMQMRDTQRWNVRKTSEEMLASLLTGDFPRLMDRLVADFGWDILSHTHYDTVVEKMDAGQRVQVDLTLRNILRHLEVICINMKNRIIDEEICFDYLQSILVTFYINCDSFILRERERRREQQIFRNTEAYARKWLELTTKSKNQAPFEQIRREFAKAG